MLSVVIDYRERNEQLLSIIQKVSNVVVRFEKLSVGDYVFPSLIVERKSFLDFCESIKDGRLFRQATQLSRSNIQPIIIVEIIPGESNKSHISSEVILGAMITLSVLYNIPVFRSNSFEQTCNIMFTTSRQIENFGLRSRCLRRPPPTKKSKNSKYRMQMHILQGFPGIGPQRASHLLERFGTLIDIFKAGEVSIESVPGFHKKLIKEMLNLLN